MSCDSARRLDPARVRSRLEAARGPEYWRSLEELAETEEFARFLEQEFPAGAAVWSEGLSRRGFLRLAGASLALAGAVGCTRRPAEKVLPYARSPEGVVPGEPLYFATSFILGGIGTGILVESHTGRPTKVEGNAEHPASLGATDAFAQASILSLYDPDRSQAVAKQGAIRSWDSLLGEVRTAIERLKPVEGAGLRVLTETVTSPTLAAQLEAVLKAWPRARWHSYEPIHSDAARAGAILAFGEDVETRYRFELADVVVSLDADFLFDAPGSVRYARDFAARRRPDAPGGRNRLHVAETSPSITGSMADERRSVRPGEVAAAAAAIAARLGAAGPREADLRALSPEAARWVEIAVRDLNAHAGAAVVLAGRTQPAEVHALVHAVNARLGNVGKTVIHTAPLAASVDQTASLRELARDLREGAVSFLVVLGGNPVYTAPPELGLSELLPAVPLTVRLGLHEDETSACCQWHVPEAHALESWGDCLAFDGTASILQPLIAPLYGGKSAIEMLAALLGDARPSGYEVVRAHWKKSRGEADFEKFWRKAVHDGLIEGSALPEKRVVVRPEAVQEALALLEARAAAATRRDGVVEVAFRPDPATWDGRFANNGWLQELPRPLSKLTWDNVAAMAPAMAERLGVASGDVVELERRGHAVQAPVWVQPGHADQCITVTLGYGRTRGGKVAEGVGFNAYLLRDVETPWTALDVKLRKTGGRWELASTQHQYSMEGRDLVRVQALGERAPRRDLGDDREGAASSPPGLYPPREYPGYAWGMTIDLNTCTGCSACVVACQAENNIPVVGKEQVAAGRAMHWIRVDRYFKGGIDDPELVHQPVPCMHCENAPCEVVCPVAATVHSSEGLNDMVYNRCVGTRYCSNNCPYKVRRFNFLQYADWETPSLKLGRNPNVTVRSRGVMEKCTYCVQRISAARIRAEKEGRRIRDGELKTACQAVCPAQAIVFGDVNDAASRVAKSKADPRSYGLLTELNTRPRTTYLARIHNPAPREHGG